eukprot:4494744-Prymnesium_polylepis.1
MPANVEVDPPASLRELVAPDAALPSDPGAPPAARGLGDSASASGGDDGPAIAAVQPPPPAKGAAARFSWRRA